MNKTINFYRTSDPYGEFSNFSKHPIELEGKIWPSTEHYFQAAKFFGTDDEWAEKIRCVEKPRDAARMGRDKNKHLREDWEDVKENVMLKALRAKFDQYDGLRSLLLSTDDSILVEHTRNDSYWGDGGDGTGKNRLGRLLMIVRDFIRCENQSNDFSSKNLITSFFEPFTNMVLSDGGDGGGTIITRYSPAKLVADWYEEWQSNKKCKFERENRPDGSVSFWDNQEGFRIIDGNSLGKSGRYQLTDGEVEHIKQCYLFGDYVLII